MTSSKYVVSPLAGALALALSLPAAAEIAADGAPADAAPMQAKTLDEVRTWMQVFMKRFFANQFKRSALPNGPKVSPSGTMSPRGDWRMPSDAKATAWLAEIERDVPTG